MAEETATPTTREFLLPSGKKATIAPFKGKHVKQAQKMAGDDPSNYIWCIMALTVTIEGEGLTPEDFDEMDGQNVMKLMTEFGEGFLSAQNP
jgi:hypothetical protein